MNSRTYDNIFYHTNRCMRYIYEHGLYIWIATSVVLFLLSMIYAITTGIVGYLFVIAALFGSVIAAWCMLLVYMLPFGIIQLTCYCIQNPIVAIKTAGTWIVSAALFFFLMYCLFG